VARYFTVEEANAVVGVIRPLVREILEIRRTVIARRPAVWPVLQRAVGNGGSRAASEMVTAFVRLDTIVREIQATEAILKDINRGLVDFLALRDGREIYLCWEYDEEEIQYWHELHTGYAGRQPIE